MRKISVAVVWCLLLCGVSVHCRADALSGTAADFISTCNDDFSFCKYMVLQDAQTSADYRHCNLGMNSANLTPMTNAVLAWVTRHADEIAEETRGAAITLALEATYPCQGQPPFVGLHYVAGSAWLNQPFTKTLRIFCGDQSLIVCAAKTGIVTPAQLVRGTLPPGMVLTPRGEITGRPSHTGFWTGTVRFPGYWVDSAGMLYKYGDVYADFHLQVNY